MRTSEQTNEIAAALAKAQGKIGNAILNKTNPHFKSRYADLAAVRDAVTPSLAENGIAVVQLTAEADGRMIVYTRMMHSSGQWVESAYPVFNDVNKPQAMGSAMTYARRYSLAAMCGIASEEDDDGNEADDHGKKSPEVRNIAGTQGARKAPARTDFDMLMSEMRKAQTLDALKEWASLRRADIDKLPGDWIEHLREEYDKLADELKARAP
jgi:hypothetical protein